jgi:hypothetical protein
VPNAAQAASSARPLATAGRVTPRRRAAESLYSPAIAPGFKRHWLGIVVAAVVLVPGCGGESDNEGGPLKPAQGLRDPSELRLTEADVAAAPEDGPYRELLRWWRALQAGDAKAAASSYARGAKPSGLEAQLRGLEGLETARPFLISPRVSGDRATLRVVIRSAFTQAENGVTVVDDLPYTFELKREGGAWKLADNRYLRDAAYHAEHGT